MKIRKALFFIFCLFTGYHALAQLGGRTTYGFLNLPYSARVTALGGNLISVKDNDLNLVQSNPSLLTDSMGGNVAMSFSNYIVGINYGSFAIAKRFKHGGNFCAGVNYLDYGKMSRADAVGNQSGEFGANETCFNLAYAHPVVDSNFTIGVNLKTISSHMENYTSIGSALDFGVTFKNPNHSFTFAYVVKNVGLVWKPYVEGHRENLPFEMQMGISLKPKQFPVRLSVIYENLEKWDLVYNNPNISAPLDPLTGEGLEEKKGKVFGDKLMRHIVIGTEFMVTKNLFLRLGYNYQMQVELNNPAPNKFSGCSFGFGFRIYKFHFSYGRAVYNLAGVTNNFSISFNLNSFYTK